MVTGLVRLGPVRGDVWVPLRFDEEGFRRQDYDEPRDFTRIGRCTRVDAGDYTAPPDQFDPTCAPYRWAGHGLHDRVYFSARVHPLTTRDDRRRAPARAPAVPPTSPKARARRRPGIDDRSRGRPRVAIGYVRS